MTLGSLYALFALGIALIFGIMRLVNFAHGELIMVGMYVIVLLTDRLVLPLLIAATIGVVVLFALAMERVAFRPVRETNPATLMVTSFAVAFLLQNLATLIMGALPRTTEITASVSKPISVGGISFPRLDVITMAVGIILMAGLAVFLAKTPIGVQMRASAENFRMARLLGVPANRVIATAFAISGVLAGTASYLFIAQTGTVWPTIGITPLIVAFFATVLGGLGSLPGAVLGGFILGSLTVAFQMALPDDLRTFRDAFVYGVVIAMLLVRPQGLIVPPYARTRV